MKRIYFPIALILLLSWTLEFVWVRFHSPLDFRIAGIHMIPLLLVPLASVWLLLPKGSNLITIFGRIGRLRWWLAAILLPACGALAGGGAMFLLGIARIPDNVNIATRILALIVDLPLNFVLWFPELVSTELCWRGVFQHGGGSSPAWYRNGFVSSLLWMISLGGIGFAGFGEKGFSFMPGIAALLSLVFIGWYQSAIYRKSGSVLVSCMSLLCIVLMISLVQELPLTVLEPMFEYAPRAPGHYPVGILVSSLLLAAAGLFMWRRRGGADPVMNNA